MTSTVCFLRDMYLQLRFLIERGLGDSEAADALRDRMDGPWYAMTDEEKTAFRESIR